MRESSLQYPWRDRKDSIFWSGTLWPSSNADVRKIYANCSAQNYSRIVFNQVIWGDIRQYRNYAHLTNNRDMKPICLDTRRAQEHKFGIYLPGNSWSSYLKRLLSSRVFPILPRQIRHHSLTLELLLQHCQDCFLTYDPLSHNLCNDLDNLISSATNTSAALQCGEQILNRLAQFVDYHLSFDSTLEYMYTTIVSLSKQQSRKYVLSFLDKHKSILSKFDCQKLRKDHYKQPPWGTKTMWQYDEWYDETCAMRLDNTYLRYVAI